MINEPRKFEMMDLDQITNQLIIMHQQIIEAQEKLLTTAKEFFNSKNRIHLIVEKLFKDLKLHIYKEEKILFPYLINLSKTIRHEIPFEEPFFGSVKNPVEILKSDHEQILEYIEILKKFVQNNEEFQNSEQLVCYELKYLMYSLEKILYLENEILFPKAISAEIKINRNNNYGLNNF